ncbi:hypothetical protein VC83_09547 [Pseudogymnoascus destructans]|uniref:Uncharacterized protein n=1 Tax=Pseudogymnoascus destructans TaxID=655981 RepID=A0A176ZWS4_9PEZI|nr:uncharacterized protein VC83_09547 [Pseudogymnoascus destructans]OAF54227.1 hypothetical protein VC83_09547 [Pseudogymnoascus destructans]
MTLLSAEVRTLRAANEALSKRRRAKKSRVRQGCALSVGDAHDDLSQRAVTEQINREKRSGGVGRNEGQPGTEEHAVAYRVESSATLINENTEARYINDNSSYKRQQHKEVASLLGRLSP